MDKSKYTEVAGGLSVDDTWPVEGEDLSVGDTIEGRYIEKVEGVGKHKTNVYVLEVGTRRTGVWGNTVLDTKFGKIATGKMVAVEYLGKKESKTGSEYKDFWVGEGVVAVGDETPAKDDTEDLPF